MIDLFLVTILLQVPPSGPKINQDPCINTVTIYPDGGFPFMISSSLNGFIDNAGQGKTNYFCMPVNSAFGLQTITYSLGTYSYNLDSSSVVSVIDEQGIPAISNPSNFWRYESYSISGNIITISDPYGWLGDQELIFVQYALDKE